MDRLLLDLYSREDAKDYWDSHTSHFNRQRDAWEEWEREEGDHEPVRDR